MESLLSNLIVRLFPSIEKTKHTGRHHTHNTHRKHTPHIGGQHNSNTYRKHTPHTETAFPNTHRMHTLTHRDSTALHRNSTPLIHTDSTSPLPYREVTCTSVKDNMHLTQRDTTTTHRQPRTKYANVCALLLFRTQTNKTY